MRAILAVLIVGTVFAVPQAEAQGSAAISDFVSANPGARSIGFAGAFAAIADDATAAYANPAGLVQLLRPEISAEIRATALVTDSETLLQPTPEATGLGFISFVYPGRSWAAAVYSHQLASVSVDVLDPFPFVSELTIRSYAAAAALQLNEDLSLGVGLAYYLGDRGSSSDSAAIADADVAFNAGLLWRPSPRWSVAGFYRQGPSFDVELGPLHEASTAHSAPPPKIDAASSRLVFPDVYGLGAAFRPGGGAATIGFEWDRVETAIDPLLSGTQVDEGGDQFHLGGEYAVLRWKPVAAFRAGVWLEPEARQDDGAGSGVTGTPADGGRTHTAIGFGLAFKRFQFDVGFDLSDRADIVSLSMVYSF